MTIPEFYAALQAVEPALYHAQNTTDPNDIATLMIALAVHGLVLLPIDMNSLVIPQPICYTIMFPSGDSTNQAKHHYLIPADQVAV